MIIYHAFEVPPLPVAPYPCKYFFSFSWLETFSALCDCSEYVVLIHPFVILDGFAYHDDWSQCVEKAEHDAIELLQCDGKKCIDKMKERFADKDKEKPHIQLFKETGRPGELICNFCKDVKPSMLIVGSRGQGTLRRTFLGSVSDYCIHHNETHCPVLVVPPPLEHTESSEDDSKAEWCDRMADWYTAESITRLRKTLVDTNSFITT